MYRSMLIAVLGLLLTGCAFDDRSAYRDRYPVYGYGVQRYEVYPAPYSYRYRAAYPRSYYPSSYYRQPLPPANYRLPTRPHGVQLAPGRIEHGHQQRPPIQRPPAQRPPVQRPQPPRYQPHDPGQDMRRPEGNHGPRGGGGGRGNSGGYSRHGRN